MKVSKSPLRLILVVVSLFVLQNTSTAQTEQDGIMMAKNNFCVGLMYGHSSWKNYWEGTLKRDNQNLGTVSNNMYSVMGNYGVNKWLNVIFGVPYITTKATAGTLHGLRGIQDLSLWVKGMPIETKLGKKGTLSVYTLVGGSLPLSNYTPDLLPLSIGLRSRTLSGRLMIDYQYGHAFITGSGTYTYRGNIEIDRTSYYTTELILSNQVEIPNVATWSVRAGYRSNRLIAEAIITDMHTLGGFDIRRNDMPFPSNKMNALMAGVNAKYDIPGVAGLSITGGANYVLSGRNVGQSLGFNIGAFYIFDFSGKKHEENPLGK